MSQIRVDLTLDVALTMVLLDAFVCQNTRVILRKFLADFPAILVIHRHVVLTLSAHCSATVLPSAHAYLDT